MKKNRPLAALLLAGAVAATTACSDDDNNGSAKDSATKKDSSVDVDSGTEADGSMAGDSSTDVDAAPPVADCPTHPNVKEDGAFCVLGGDDVNTITESLTIGPVKDKRWVLEGRVIVGEDVGGAAAPDATKKSATLTVLPGTVIEGENAKLSYLVISRGSKLIANGTKEQPIVFTALADEKAPESWGGIAINGRARATCGTTCQSEGEAGSFGGPDDEDDSGSLKYVRVEWAGYEFSLGNELNGIAFNAVGDKTVVDYVQVHYNGDDGIEMFGGTVNIKHAVLAGNGDDNIDWQLGWRGKLQHAVVLLAPGRGERGIEADNAEGNADQEPISNPTLANLTILRTDATPGDGIHLRRGTKGALHSVLVQGFVSCLNVTADAQARLPADLTIAGSRIGCTTNFANAPSGTNFFAVDTSNQEVEPATLLAELQSVSITDPDFRLKPGSALLTGGSKVAGDAFFDQVDYIGAFDDTTDWTAGWTAFPAPDSLPAN